MTENTELGKAIAEGKLSFPKGEFGKSISDFSAAIRLDPERQAAYLTREIAYMKTDRVNLAIYDFNKAIELNPASRRAYHLRGLAYHMKGESEKALEAEEKRFALSGSYLFRHTRSHNFSTLLTNSKGNPYGTHKGSTDGVKDTCPWGLSCS